MLIHAGYFLALASPSPEYHPDCSRPHDYNDASVCAYVRQAVAAESANSAAWWAIGLSALSTLGVLGTLVYNAKMFRQSEASQASTAQALQIASQDANAATKLADNAEENAKRELRAYLGIKRAVWNNNLHKCTITIANFGKTPTNSSNLAISRFFGPSKSGVTNRPLGAFDPNSECTMVMYITEQTLIDLKLGASEGQKFEIEFWIWYKDIFNCCWERAIKFQLDDELLSSSGDYTLNMTSNILLESKLNPDSNLSL